MAHRIEPLALPPLQAGVRADARFLGRWVLLGAAAGGVGGVLVGGIGGRLAMFVLRLTSPDGVRGLTSDDGFEIGRFTTSTFSLLALTFLLGAVAGLVYIAVRGFLPPRLRVAAWALAGATVGGSLLLHGDGIDFNRLKPAGLACGLFIAIPAGGAALIAWFAERWAPWWCVVRRPTRLGSVAGIAGLLTPVTIVVVVACLATLVAGRVAVLRSGAERAWGRVLCRGGYGLVVVVGANALVRDLRDIL